MVISEGHLLGNYRLLARLGAGGFAEVYLGEHQHLHTKAAIKVLHSRLDAEAIENFRVEALKIAHLAHPHIVRVLDFGVADRTPYLVMDYASHGTLRQKHPSGTTLPLATIISYITQIASALQYIHQQKLIHCDVKPANMLIGQDEQILLSDFGIATTTHTSTSFVQLSPQGTAPYMAPEQLNGKPHIASDQYALGIVVYEWLSGSRPFNGSVPELYIQHQTKTPPPLYPAIPGVSSAIEQVVMKALAKSPQERYSSIGAFADALQQAAQLISSSPVEQNAQTQHTHFQQPRIILSPTHSSLSSASLAEITSVNNELSPVQQDKQDIQNNSKKKECFQCVLDRQQGSCAVPELSGRLLGAYERTVNGTKTPIIGLTTSTGRVDVHLTDYYQKFVRELQERGPAIRDLAITFYHLPQPPATVESKGQTRLVFQANSYTLAVLEPDILLNITDLSQADYCSRQYLLHSLVTSPPNAATIRGNLIHYCFKELLKAHNLPAEAQDDKPPLALLQHHLAKTLQQNAIDLALANVTIEAMHEDVQPHLESLAAWYQEQQATLWDLFTKSKRSHSPEKQTTRGESEVSAETFLLAPEIGLKGRLDLYWQQESRQRLLELKTGGAKGDVPKSAHRRQVNGYSALLTVRRNEKEKAEATLLYSGTPNQAQSCHIPFSIRELQRVVEMRNILVLSHITGVPSAPPGPSRCTKCTLLNTCTTVSSMLKWQAPEPAREEPAHFQSAPALQLEPDISASLLPKVYGEADRTFFAKYYDLLRIEGIDSERSQALLWQSSPEERVERGTAILGLIPTEKAEQKGQGEWWQTFSCNNTSELREGEEILLSDGDPIKGMVVTGTILKINTREVKVWTPELIDNPTLIDRNENNLVHMRTLKNLLRWLEVDEHLRQLVHGSIRPRFSTVSPPQPNNPKFNAAQQQAVEKALQMHDYLLIQGPPGTGKTSVIAAIVQCLCAQGQRVLLAAFTNQAVDNMLRRLDSEGFSNYVRLGHDRSVHADVQKRLLKNLLEPPTDMPRQEPAVDVPPPTVSEILHNGQVVASTTATWSSEKYAAPALHDRADHAAQLPLQFDVAIIDEASQLTVPAILGALRLAKRFILVGDDKQLPPLVISDVAAELGLSTSLFSFLKQCDEDYMQTHEDGESACVTLQVQHRMNKWISRYSSKVFYQDWLVPSPQVAERILAVKPVSPPLLAELPAITKAIEPRYPLVFLDVRPPGEQQLHNAKSNDSEAQAIRTVVQGLLARGIQEEEIGIIAPFRAQVANVRRHLFGSDEVTGWQGISPETPMLIDTVDRFQGGERTVIIMSFTIAQPPSTIGSLHTFLTNPNRLNVALTRAKCKLILIGCVPALESLPYFERLLAYCRSMKTMIPYN